MNKPEELSPQNHSSTTASIIAIDGPAGAGKSTVAKQVAKALGYLYIDSGAMYRAVTWLVLKNKVPSDNLESIVKLVSKSVIELKSDYSDTQNNLRVYADGQEITNEIRSPQVTGLVSPISAIPGVRQYLVIQQQQLADSGHVVMDGRDIGTVVLPNADLKIFLTASPEIRAQRRLVDLENMGEHPVLDSVLRDINNRDHRDSTRAVAPLRQASDAIAINTDDLSIEQVVQKILELCKK